MFDQETVRDIIQWDIINWGKAIPYWNDILSNKKKLICLETGARKGGLSLLSALYGHKTICSDIENPKIFAQPLHIKYNVEHLISYESLDLLNINYENFFDIIFMKSILPTIGANEHKELQEKAISEIYKSLKPGGFLLFAENLEASQLHSFARKKFVPWGDKVRYLKISEINKMFESFTELNFKTTGFLALFGRNEKQRKVFGKLDDIFENLTPKSWRYIVIGIARK